MEENYREISVMKAISITSKDIQKLYVTKYVVISAGGCKCGYILSRFVTKIFTSNIALYMGAGKSDIRIDLQQSENIEQRFKGVISRI